MSALAVEKPENISDLPVMSEGQQKGINRTRFLKRLANLPCGLRGPLKI